MPPESTQTKALRGRVIHAPAFGDIEEWPDGAVVWDAAGRIVNVGPAAATLAQYPDAAVEDVRPALILPGLVDAHTHLPQYPAAGVGATDLLAWLDHDIFPLERRFRADAAEALAPAFFHALAANGSSSAAVYLAVFHDSATVCFQHAEASGLRVTMGKMMMDDVTYSGTAPTLVVDQSLNETDDLCRAWHGRDAGRIRYAVSPRFAVACSEAMLRGAAEIASWYGAAIQTHLSETVEELHVVAKRFPDARDYTDVYERAGILGPRTVLGHAIHLSDRERDALAATGSSVAHCPTSNFYLASGLMAADRLMEAGVTVGLGSDVAAGPELSMWRVMRAAVETRNARAATTPGVAPLSARHAFHLATLGGARALGIAEVAGSLEPGKEADILVADPATVAPPGVALDEMTAEQILSLCVWRGDERLTRRLYVRGSKVFER
ncbi:MAG TPA: guanine deaminase [Armatimonadota bacterium]